MWRRNLAEHAEHLIHDPIRTPLGIGIQRKGREQFGTLLINREDHPSRLPPLEVALHLCRTAAGEGNEILRLAHRGQHSPFGVLRHTCHNLFTDLDCFPFK